MYYFVNYQNEHLQSKHEESNHNPEETKLSGEDKRHEWYKPNWSKVLKEYRKTVFKDVTSKE